MKILDLKIDGEEKTFKVPTSWDDISVGTYQKLISVEETNNKIDMEINQLALLLDMDVDIVEMIPTDDFKDINNEFKFVGEPMDDKQTDSIIIDDVEYFRKDNFDILNVAEVKNINTLTKNIEGRVDKHISKLLCILLRKKRDDGELEEFRSSFMEREELFKTIGINKVYKMIIFFLDGKKN